MACFTCPVCGHSLASPSRSARLGRHNCLERSYPALKTQRSESARRAKLEYDRLHENARRVVLRDLAMQVLKSS
ncbi:hypothetical protein PC129_g12905 [Phytophthora cactorum]|uniref:Uncharacterized protein n=1 Tax=Phytophthora cactorum TaxID=29920 RepID=A0A8T1HVD7_9STRA|nr:hypothetical protein PC112_g12784 [Phytophthora cactorum]KAG2895105.1 hypothetical protein PC114_g15610 [Phytophthora cactorum]KAG2924637.1 hypothetical protein PC117_g15361 [Phytophthora cactorum]KAG3011064.1 hypothetical protein PC120_g14664 [Phytophthora cactorum]KAG3157068.1 hypothetical protein C6341_g14878 [Phytophthora cactorum]